MKGTLMKKSSSKKLQVEEELGPSDPFMIIRRGDIDEIRKMLESGKVNLHQTRWTGFTFLHRAAEIGHSELCLLLIDLGIPVNVRSTRGWYTPLHIALGNGYLDTAMKLIEQGGNPWTKSKYNEDAFEFGIKRGFQKITEEFRLKIIKMDMKKVLGRHDQLLGGSSTKANKKESEGVVEDVEDDSSPTDAS